MHASSASSIAAAANSDTGILAEETTIIGGTATVLCASWMKRRPDERTSMYVPYDYTCINVA
jgi:hypothetical protein